MSAVDASERSSPSPDNPIRKPGRAGAVLAILALLTIAAVLPLLASDYRISQATMTIIMAIGVLGLNMLVGYNGQISLGHGAIYALGAYTAAILIDRVGLAWWATIPIAGAVCFVFGFLFGWPALRLKGHYLALATFALALAAPQLLKDKALEQWTGGVQGIVLTPPEAPFGWALSPDQWLYYVTTLIAAAMFLVAWNILRGRLGRAMIAIREQPIAASAMGVNVPYVKAMTFGISSMYRASPERSARSRRRLWRRTASACLCRYSSSSAASSAASARYPARSSALYSSNLCPTSPTRSRSRRPRRSTRCFSLFRCA